MHSLTSRIFRLFHNVECAVVIGVAALFTVLNALQVILQWFVNPPGYTFTAITHFYADYFLYVYQMAQGAQGTLLTDFLFTNEPIRATWLYWFNALIGFIGRLVGLDPFSSYNVTLAVQVFTLIILWHVLLCKLFPQSRAYRMVSLIVLLTASPFISLSEYLKTGELAFPVELWFSPTPSFWRLGGVPHQVFQTIIIVLFILTYARLSDGWTRKRATYLAMLSFVIMSAYPMQALNLLAGTSFVSLISLIRTRKLSSTFPILLVSGAAIPAAFITSRELSLPPFAVAKSWELAQQVPKSLDHFFLSHGPMMFFLPFGIVPYFAGATTIRRVFAGYGLAALVIYYSPLPAILGANPIRFFHPASHAFLATLSGVGIVSIGRVTARILERFKLKTPAKSRVLISSFAFLIYAVLTAPSVYKQVENRITPAKNWLLLMDTEYNHVPPEIVEGLMFIRKQDEPQDKKVILGDDAVRLELLIPVFTLKPTFVGHPLHTLYPDYKENLRAKFFAGQMTFEESRGFLRDHRIGYIMTNPLQDRVPQSSLTLLTQIFENSRLRIYRVND